MRSPLEKLEDDCAQLMHERDEALAKVEQYRDFCAGYRREVARLKMRMHNLRTQRDEARTELGLPITTRTYK